MPGTRNDMCLRVPEVSSKLAHNRSAVYHRVVRTHEQEQRQPRAACLQQPRGIARPREGHRCHVRVLRDSAAQPARASRVAHAPPRAPGQERVHEIGLGTPGGSRVAAGPCATERVCDATHARGERRRERGAHEGERREEDDAGDGNGPHVRADICDRCG